MTRSLRLWQRLLLHSGVALILAWSMACGSTATQPSSTSTTTTQQTPPACSIRLWACTSTYGAIAYSSSTRASGIAYNYNTRADAENAAIGYCGKSDCATAAWFSNSCGAIATAPTGQMATGLGSTGDFAQATALASCVLK